MKNAKLGQVADVSSGQGAPQEKDAFGLEGIPFIRAGSLPLLCNGLSESELEKITPNGAKKHRLRLFPKGTILFAKSGMSATKGHVYQTQSSAYVVSHLAAIIPFDNLDGRFLLNYFLKNPVTHLIRDSAYPSIRLEDISALEIPLPPLGEQKRIAAILDKADDLRQKRRRALARLDDLLQSVFLEMFGDPVRNEKGWEVRKLGETIRSIRYGTGSPPSYVNEGIPFIRATNIKGGTIVANGLVYISEASAANIEKCRVNKGDLLLVRSGVNTGDSAVVPEKYDGAYAAYDLIITLDLDWAVFLNQFINSSLGRSLIRPLTRRAGQPHLNADQVKALEIIKPSSESLAKFRGHVENIEIQRQVSFLELEKFGHLFKALQQYAFRGRP